MMLAYQENPESFGDAYDAAGLPSANGIPDIVDEIKWGLDWLNQTVEYGRCESVTPGQDYERFQPDLMVYHDALHDYSTNEPTMDGTACLTYYLSTMQKEDCRSSRSIYDKIMETENKDTETERIYVRSGPGSGRHLKDSTRMARILFNPFIRVPFHICLSTGKSSG